MQSGGRPAAGTRRPQRKGSWLFRLSRRRGRRRTSGRACKVPAMQWLGSRLRDSCQQLQDAKTTALNGFRKSNGDASHAERRIQFDTNELRTLPEQPSRRTPCKMPETSMHSAWQQQRQTELQSPRAYGTMDCRLHDPSCNLHDRHLIPIFDQMFARFTNVAVISALVPSTFIALRWNNECIAMTRLLPH